MLQAQLAKKGAQVEKVVLGEIFQRVIVAFHTFHSAAEKEPAHRCGRQVYFEIVDHDVCHRSPEAGCGVLSLISNAAQHLPNHLIVRPVFVQKSVDVPPESALGPTLDGCLVVPEAVFKLRSPECRVLRPCQQLVDEAATFVLATVVQKPLPFSRRRKKPDHVEVDAAQELVVAGQLRRIQIQPPQLLEDGLVNEVVCHQSRIVFRRRLLDHTDARHADTSHASNHHVRLPGRHGFRSPVRLHCHDVFIFNLVADLASHVTCRPVRNMPEHNKVLGCSQAHKNPVFGEDFQVYNAGTVGIVGGPLPQPVQDRLVLLRVLGQPQPAAVGYAERRLSQNQALFWVFKVDTPAVLVFHDHLVIGLGIIAEERKLEAVLTSNGTVTGWVVARLLGEDRKQILTEIHGHPGLIVGHAHTDSRTGPSHAGSHKYPAWGYGFQDTIRADRHNSGSEGFILTRLGDIIRGPIAIVTRGDQTLRHPRMAEVNPIRFEYDLLRHSSRKNRYRLFAGAIGAPLSGGGSRFIPLVSFHRDSRDHGLGGVCDKEANRYSHEEQQSHAFA